MVEKDIGSAYYLNVIWKRKWFIICAVIFCMIVAGIISFVLSPLWEVDALISPSKILVENSQGNFEELIVVSPSQIKAQINQGAYDKLIAAELNVGIRDVPKIKATNISETNLIKVLIRSKNIERAEIVLISLFNNLRKELDKKIEVEIKGIDVEVENNRNVIKNNELLIKDKLKEIELNEIEKNKLRQEIASAEKKFQISEERVKSILDEMKDVKKRIDEIEKQQRDTLAEIKEVNYALSLLLYSNEIQQNFQYYNLLDEQLINERIVQEDFQLLIKQKREDIKKYNTQIEILRTEIDKVNNEINSVKNEIELLNKRKARLDYAQLIKEPTTSRNVVSKTRNVLMTGILGIIIFSMFAFLIEHVEKKQKVD